MNEGETRITTATPTEGETLPFTSQEELDESEAILLTHSSFRSFLVDGEALYIDLRQVAGFGGVNSGSGVQVFMKSGDDWIINDYPVSQFVFDMVSANGLEV